MHNYLSPPPRHTHTHKIEDYLIFEKLMAHNDERGRYSASEEQNKHSQKFVSVVDVEWQILQRKTSAMT